MITLAFAGEPIALGDIFLDERFDHVGLQHVVLQRCQHLLFEFADTHRQFVGAAGVGGVGVRVTT
ncbi:hypothetical protein [Sphingomonas aurantiaca]|uniref:hypothetical protein n=1 Tax=Sphingomonas aurantiaca TaxID=185949 RepID=UPI000D364CDF|nr:hypothetical protein [Sphingomonas aurantiaca]